MCDPMTAMLAFTAVSTVSGFVGAQQDAEAQRDSAEANYQAQMADLAARQAEIDGTALEEKSDVAKEALLRKGQLRVATGEAGVSGLVVDSLLNDVQTQAGAANSRIETNRTRATSQNNRAKESAYASAKSTINSARDPSVLGLVSDLGMSGLQIHNQFKTPTTKTPTKKVT